MMILTVGKGVGMKNNNIIEINNLSFAYSKMDTGHLSQDKNQNILKNISINNFDIVVISSQKNYRKK